VSCDRFRDRRMRKTLAILVLLTACDRASAANSVPPPAIDEHVSDTSDRFAVFAGGCFWGIEAVFEHVKGVKKVTSGYSGGTAATAHYDIVSSGKTGHAEAGQIVYHPTQISYRRPLQILVSVRHSPTQLNHQGPDYGTQYRSAVFVASAEQKKIAQAYIDQLNKARAFGKPIVTEVTELDVFYPAETYHQDYAAHHPNDLYIVINDAP